MGFERFIKLWMHPAFPPRPVDEAGMQQAERHFGFAFPRDYRETVLQHGLLTPSFTLEKAILDREIDMPGLGCMFDPRQIINITEYWRENGMPPQMVAFASDRSGNFFCFDLGVTDQIFFYDHDFGTTTISPSFTAWIEAYCALGEP